jgi:hypothetical protein
MTQKDVTYQDKLSELRLDLSHPNSKGVTFILLEGMSDVRLYRKLFNKTCSKVERVPGGKLKLEQCVADLVITHSNVIGIRDADFLHLSSSSYSCVNMFLTDHHDIEMTLVSFEEVFISLLNEFLDESSVIQHRQLTQTMFDVLMDLSCLKWLNELETFGLNFNAVGFVDLISFKNSSFDIRSYLQRVLAKSSTSSHLTTDLILKKIETLKKSKPSELLLISGHDFIKALTSYFNQFRQKGLSNEIVASICRVKFSKELFMTTALHKSVSGWASSNSSKICE